MYLNFAGVVDKHITSIEKNVYPTHQEGQNFMEDFLKAVCIDDIASQTLYFLNLEWYCTEEETRQEQP